MDRTIANSLLADWIEEGWITPQSALTAVSETFGAEHAKWWLISRFRTMQIPLRARGIHFDYRFSLKRYANIFLDHEICGYIDDDNFKTAWTTADFGYAVSDGFSPMLKVTVAGVEIQQEPLLQQLGKKDMADGQSPQRTGGRPAPNHGEVIASMTKQLSTLSNRDLQKLTNQGVAADLLQLYQRQARTPPSQDSLEKYAGGILRVLRGNTH